MFMFIVFSLSFDIESTRTDTKQIYQFISSW